LNNKPGVNLLPDLSENTVAHIKKQVNKIKRQGDIIVVSIHWGGNWGYNIAPKQTAFAHKLIDAAGVDLIHGHSSHHAIGIEVYKHKLILYGSGDFLNDYEGIQGHENYRGDLALMYFPSIDPMTGKFVRMQMIPMQIKHLKVNNASKKDTRWLKRILDREGKKFGTQVHQDKNNILTLEWD